MTDISFREGAYEALARSLGDLREGVGKTEVFFSSLIEQNLPGIAHLSCARSVEERVNLRRRRSISAMEELGDLYRKTGKDLLDLEEEQRRTIRRLSSAAFGGVGMPEDTQRAYAAAVNARPDLVHRAEQLNQ